MSHAWERRKLYNILVRKPEWKRPLGRTRCKWDDEIKMDLRETGWKGVEWIHLARDREYCWAVVSMVMNPWVLAPWS
jgi:hypothetical protein